LRDAILALNRMFFPGARNDTPIAGGVSWWFKQDEIHQATHVHKGPAFLPWHRELCNRLEAMLRQVDPLVSLHYWDWTTDPRRSPDGQGGFVNIFTSGFMGSSSGSAGEPWLSGGFYSPTANPFRSDAPRFPGAPPGPNQNPADLPRTLDRRVGPTSPPSRPSDEEIVAAATFPQMRRLLEERHNVVHGYIGGTLGAPHLSFRDPFVFLLHSNVDRLFALWQAAAGHPERLDPSRVYGEEGDSPGRAGIVALMEPWAGNATNDSAVLRVRPWAPPENEDRLDVNRKNSRHPSVVRPPLYDADSRVISLRSVLIRKGLDPARGIRGPMTEANAIGVREFVAS
jgi:hypothetical protein